MAFPPSLLRLLALRQSLERQEELKLAMIAGRLHAARRQLADTRRARHRGAAHRFDGYESDVGELRLDASTGGLLRLAELTQSAAREREAQLETAVTQLETAHQAQCAALAERTRERKILETLRDHHLATVRRDQLRRTQAALDEMYVMRPR